MGQRGGTRERTRKLQGADQATAKRTAAQLLLGTTLRDTARRAVAVGTFSIEMSSPASIAALALAGFDFVVLDMEHSANDFTSLEPLLLAANAAGLAAIVRPCSASSDVIGKLLDMGAHGIMAAHVQSAAHARAIVAQTRFPPLGQRSFSPLSRFDALARPIQELDRAAYLILQIEGREALDDIESIAAVPGIDALFVGPYDLSLALGVAPDSREVIAAAKRVARAAPSDIALGVYIDDAVNCGAWASRGYNLQCVSFDGRMFANSARAIASGARRSIESRKKIVTSRSRQ